MKTFGIYLCYPPKVDLRTEGLGRYLLEFLKAANFRSDVDFVIACPSWMRISLLELFESAGLRADAFEIISPAEVPTLFRLYEEYQQYKAYKLRRKKRLRRYLSRLKQRFRSILSYSERTIATTRSSAALLAILLIGFPIILLGLALRSLIQTLRVPGAFQRIFRKPTPFASLSNALAATRPQDNHLALRLYRHMEAAEAKLIAFEINKRTEVSAWFAPAAFWPQFNDIDAPRLICVPDVVLSDLPVSFSAVHYERFLETFKLVERTIKGGDHFVTYSFETKQKTLVERYGVPRNAVTVIPHGSNRLDDLISISGFINNDDATDSFCATVFRSALNKSVNTLNPSRFAGSDIDFIFYASQFRPNKNVLTLLRAYEYLLRRRYIRQKLILTGNPSLLPEIGEFIRSHDLQNDVLCLHGLSDQELAACYRLATLAVNPSLSEGGCPFTLTEALSVGTPVVMARIAVTEEVVIDAKLQDLMFFDPYSWKDMAMKIEWALANRGHLLDQELLFYNNLSKRSWSNVVDDYVALLDRISADRLGMSCLPIK